MFRTRTRAGQSENCEIVAIRLAFEGGREIKALEKDQSGRFARKRPFTMLRIGCADI